MNLEEETKFIMNKYNISASKNLGQNFLIDENTVNGIVQNAEISKEDFVIEIGPGLGTLTSRLLENAGRVVCIELDKRMVNILEDRFALYENLEIIQEDVLKVDLQSLISENLTKYSLKQAKVVANLPYYITTPIIMKLLEDRLKLKSITVMVQKEVAVRLTQKPGTKETGAITYSIYYYTSPKLVLSVPRTSFIPAPKVDSAVIKLDVLEKPRVEVSNERLFFDIIKASFLKKRKTLVNALESSKILPVKQDIIEMLEKLGLDTQIRGERLSIEEYAKIAKYVEDFTEESGDLK